MSRKLFKEVLFPMKMSVHWVNERLDWFAVQCIFGVYDSSEKKFVIAMIG